MTDLIVIKVFGNEKQTQLVWRLIRKALRHKRFYANAILIDGPVYVKTQRGYIEIMIRDYYQ